MNHFSKRKILDSSIVSTNENDLSSESQTTEDRRRRGSSSLRKCYSCSQILVLKSNSYKTRRKSINRSVSSDEVETCLSSEGLLKKCDIISKIDSNDCKSRFDFENPIIKITQNFQNFEEFDETIDRNDRQFHNYLRLNTNISNLSSNTSAEDGSSPADMSPSDYFSHEDNWDIDSNTISCDRSSTGVPSDSVPVPKSSRPMSPVTGDCLRSRTLRSNSSDSAIIMPFIDSDIEYNISLDSATHKYNFDRSVKMDIKTEYGPHPDLWHNHRKKNSMSCPSLEMPSVVISDHSDEKSEQNSNVLALAIESYFTLPPKRRDSISSISSSCSSLSSLGEEDFIETEIQSSPCKLSPISAWKKVRSLVTSPFIQTYKKQKYPWVQLAGHQGNFLSGQTQGTILKKLSGTEEVCFQQIMSDVIRPLVPEYRKTIKINNEYYLELEDLLANFENPSIMDIKMGVRTYLEDELSKARIKPKLRKDMYEKMVAIDPKEPTEDENSLKAVTKPRYMIWRETISSTASLGFRIEGIKQSNGKAFKDFKRTKTDEQVKIAFHKFIENHQKYVSLYLKKLIVINETLKLSQFFKSHEIIGSSLLFVHDDKRADIWLIDFAKTYPLPSGITITHRDEWQVGNHEDGYLIGLESLIRIFSSI